MTAFSKMVLEGSSLYTQENEIFPYLICNNLLKVNERFKFETKIMNITDHQRNVN